MHSSYALSSDDFSVERGGKTEKRLADLWPGGYQPGDRLGVVLAQPMDAVGCSNLICATITMFYDLLREQHGTGNFFRYCDTYLFGVGCEAGDFNQLDIWPLHKWVTILQPTTEALLEAVNDRKVNLLAIPETGARCRGEVVLSTWNAYLSHVKTVVTYSPRTGRARDADVALVGNKVVESYVEQAIFSTPGIDAGFQAKLRRLRRNLDREEKQPVEEYRTLSSPAAARALLGVTQVLPPGHQELTRRATPTTILPVEVPMPQAEIDSAPFDAAAAAALVVDQPAPSGVYPDGLLRTAFDAIQRRLGGTFGEWEGWDWIADFGDPIAEHHTVRESVGIWDESPLRKWYFVGKDAVAAADRLFTSDMAALESGQSRYGPFCDEQGKMLGDGVVFRGDDEARLLVVTALDTDADHFRRACADLDVQFEEHTFQMPHLQVQGPGSRDLLAKMTDADVAGLKYFRWIPQPVTVGGVEGCYLSRTGYSGELGYEIFCSPENAERLWQALLDQGASVGIRPYGLTAVESLRIEAGLIFIGFDYFPGVTSPYHMSLDRMIKLDKPGDFIGKAALQAELDAGVTHRMVTLVIAGEESPDYGAPVVSNGRGVGKLLSPSAGRSPTVDKLIGMACIETELTTIGTQVEVTMPDGRLVTAVVDTFPIYDPEKTPAPVMSDAPIGVVASGSGGLVLARMIAARLPHEDVVALCDHAYAPWGRRPGRAVAMRVASLGDDLTAHGPKLVVLASAQGTLDALDGLRARAGVPVVGMDGLVPFAAAQAGGRPIALVTGEGCVRGLQQGRAVRRQRGGVDAVSDVWPGLAELVEAGGAASSAAADLAGARVPGLVAAGVGAILLACPHAAAVHDAVQRAAGGRTTVVDGAAVTVDRAIRLLRRSNALAHRKRAGRVIVVSSNPARGAAGLTA